MKNKGNVNIIKDIKISSRLKLDLNINVGKIHGNNKKLSLNTNCELKSLKNIYIIDGSAIPKNKSKFPTALIMSNAHRIGLNFK